MGPWHVFSATCDDHFYLHSMNFFYLHTTIVLTYIPRYSCKLCDTGANWHMLRKKIPQTRVTSYATIIITYFEITANSENRLKQTPTTAPSIHFLTWHKCKQIEFDQYIRRYSRKLKELWCHIDPEFALLYYYLNTTLFGASNLPFYIVISFFPIAILISLVGVFLLDKFKCLCCCSCCLPLTHRTTLSYEESYIIANAYWTQKLQCLNYWDIQK